MGEKKLLQRVGLHHRTLYFACSAGSIPDLLGWLGEASVILEGHLTKELQWSGTIHVYFIRISYLPLVTFRK